jgi:WD40 repeat protein
MDRTIRTSSDRHIQLARQGLVHRIRRPTRRATHPYADAGPVRDGKQFYHPEAHRWHDALAKASGIQYPYSRPRVDREWKGCDTQDLLSTRILDAPYINRPVGRPMTCGAGTVAIALQSGCHLYNWQQSRVVASLKPEWSIQCVSASPRFESLVLTSQVSNSIKWCDLQTEQKRIWEWNDATQAPEFVQDCTWVDSHSLVASQAPLNSTGSVELAWLRFDLRVNSVVQGGCAIGGDGARRVVVNPHDSNSLATAATSGSLQLWDMRKTQTPITRSNESIEVRTVAWHPTLPHVLVSNAGARGIAWWRTWNNESSWTPVWTYTRHRVYELEWHDDDQLVVGVQGGLWKVLPTTPAGRPAIRTSAQETLLALQRRGCVFESQDWLSRPNERVIQFSKLSGMLVAITTDERVLFWKLPATDACKTMRWHPIRRL